MTTKMTRRELMKSGTALTAGMIAAPVLAQDAQP